MIPAPTAISLAICEQVIVDRRSTNPSLISLYTLLRVDALPSPPQKLSMFASLTDGTGAGTLDLIVRRMDNNEQVYQMTRRSDFPDRKKIINVHFRIRTLCFPVAGLYEFLLLVDGELVARRELTVQMFENGEPGEQP
jgi:hypothetical protein